MRLWLEIIAVLMLIASPFAAADQLACFELDDGTQGSMTLPSLCATVQLQLNAADKAYNGVRLTSSSLQAHGSFFTIPAMDISRGAVVNFTYRLTDSANVPQGFALVAQAQSLYGLGEGGTGYGYAGLLNGLAVQINLKPQQVSSPFALSLHATGNTLTASRDDAIQTVMDASFPDLVDGLPHKISVEYPPVAGSSYHVAVTVDSYGPVSLGPVPSATLTSLCTNAMHVGVTAAGDNTPANQDVLAFSVTNLASTRCVHGFVRNSTTGVCQLDVARSDCRYRTGCTACTSSAFCCAFTGGSCQSSLTLSASTQAELAGECPSQQPHDYAAIHTVEVALAATCVGLFLCWIATAACGYKRYKAAMADAPSLKSTGFEFNAL